MENRLLGLIDFKKVEILLEGFNKITGFVTAIIDLEGNILCKSGWRQICTEFHRIHPETAQKCKISDTDLANKKQERFKYNSYKCLNGLTDVVVPIIIKGEHIANLFSGQFFFEKPNREFFKKQAEKYGFDEKKYLEALDKVLVISEEKVKVALDFLLSMTQLISEMALQKLEQINLNKALKESEEKMRSIYRVAPAGIGVVINRVLKEVNPRICEMTGYTREELIDENSLMLYPSQEEYEFVGKEKYDQIKAKETGKVETRWQKKDGAIINILLASAPININDYSKGVTFTALDITERKQVEEALRQSEKHNAFLAQSAFELVELTSIQEIYKYTVQKLYELMEGNSIVALVEFNLSENRWKMQQVKGVGKKAVELSRLLGFDISQMEGDISTKYYEQISSGKLVELDFDLPGLFNNKLTAATGSTVKKMFSVEKMYCITFQYDEQILGNITIITNKKTKPVKTNLIEAFIQQVSNFVKKQKAEEALRQSEEMILSSQAVAHICSYSTTLDMMR
ncbi:MAG TPA: PAS domain S-box protein [Mariniphaga anaerophila]|uniref:PAS domain S-box protein n=1 Tax=Mariniphaga anaerophila TaxID=1484053 RepID=A0A831LDS6_9BACT|nr:PAS domain S-box protein [Mariniphaga anaerophila]